MLFNVDMTLNNITWFNQQLSNKMFHPPVSDYTKWTICGDAYKFECNRRYYNNKSFIDCTYLNQDSANYIVFDVSNEIKISFTTLLPNIIQILINILIEKKQITTKLTTYGALQKYNDPCVFLKVL